jgi:hypothetical protein
VSADDRRRTTDDRFTVAPTSTPRPKAPMHWAGFTVPYPGYAWRVVRNSAILWLLLRLMLAGVLLLGGGPLALRASLLNSAVVTGLAALLVWLDARRFRETLFHANLGTHPASAPLLALGVAIGLELLVAAL